MISSCLYLLLDFGWLLTKYDLSLPITRYWYICSPFFFEKQRWINSLILDFSSVCGMVVYNIEKSNVLMLLQTYWDLELKVSSKSFECVNIHMWLTPLLEKQVLWYFWRPVLTAIEVKIIEKAWQNTWQLLWYNVVCMNTCVILVSNTVRSQSSTFIERPKEDKTDMWLLIISSFDSAVAVYVGLPCEISKSIYIFKQSM